MPVRIQRKRMKGWRMPEGAVYVGRPTMFGNPFKVKRFGLEAALALYRNSITGYWTASAVPQGTSIEVAYACHLELQRQFQRAGCRDIYYMVARLRDKDLTCWCPLDQPCHADVLLELANAAPAVAPPLESAGVSTRGKNSNNPPPPQEEPR